MTTIAKAVPLLMLIALALPARAQDITVTRWIAGAGDWHNSANWDMGLPNPEGIAIVDSGPVAISSAVTAGPVWIGFDGDGSVDSTAPMTLHGGPWIGFSGGTGDGTVEVTSGSFSITGADLNVLPPTFLGGPPLPGSIVVGHGSGTGTNTSFTGNGSFQMTDGDIDVEGHVDVGIAGGTGTNTSLNGNGDFHLLRGSLYVQGVIGVGTAGGTGSATMIGIGNMLIEHGDVIVSPDPDDFFFPGTIRIGTFDGTSSARGHGQGALTLIDGRLASEQIVIGNTSGIVDAHGSSDGRLTVRDGVVDFGSMTVGVQSGNGGPTEGVVALLSTQASGEQITVGDDGRLVFGIAGADAADYGHIEVTTAFLRGDVEARFIDSFQPVVGDVFTLIAADAITDQYSLTVTGLDLALYPYLTVVRTDATLQLAFIPEASGVIQASVALAALIAACRPMPFTNRAILRSQST